MPDANVRNELCNDKFMGMHCAFILLVLLTLPLARPQQAEYAPEVDIFERDDEVKVEGGNALFDTALPARVLVNALTKDKVSLRFNVSWGFGAGGGMSKLAAHYSRPDKTLKLFGYSTTEFGYTVRQQVWSNVTDDKLARLMEKYKDQEPHNESGLFLYLAEFDCPQRVLYDKFTPWPQQRQ